MRVSDARFSGLVPDTRYGKLHRHAPDRHNLDLALVSPASCISAKEKRMFLDYFALGILIFVAVTLFYAIIAIHDISYEIAKHRNHPHQDAIHVAGWVSLFTLHAIWPLVFMWAVSKQGPPKGADGLPREADLSGRLAEQDHRLHKLEKQLFALSKKSGAP